MGSNTKQIDSIHIMPYLHSFAIGRVHKHIRVSMFVHWGWDPVIVRTAAFWLYCRLGVGLMKRRIKMFSPATPNPNRPSDFRFSTLALALLNNKSSIYTFDIEIAIFEWHWPHIVHSMGWFIPSLAHLRKQISTLRDMPHTEMEIYTVFGRPAALRRHKTTVEC